MDWNKEKLINSMNIIIKNLNNNPNNLLYVLDYNTLLKIISLYDNQLYNDYKKNVVLFKLENIDEKHNTFYNDSILCRDKIKIETLSFCSFMDEVIIKYPLSIGNIKFYKEKQTDLVEGFLKEYSTNLYNIYLYLKNGYIKETKKLSNEKGLCFDILNTNEKYIIYRNNKLHDSSTLIHELGHIEQLTNLNGNEEKKLSYLISSFREAYSTFLSLAFNDYCISNLSDKFEKKQFIFDTGNIYDNIKDLSYSFLNCENDKDKSDYYISSLVGLYMFNLYKNNKEEFYRFNNFFQNSLCTKLDSEIIDSLPFKEINSLNIDTIYDYNRVIKKRNYKKSNRF